MNMYKFLKICDNFAWNYIRSFIQSSNTMASLDHSFFFEWPATEMVQAREREDRNR